VQGKENKPVNVLDETTVRIQLHLSTSVNAKLRLMTAFNAVLADVCAELPSGELSIGL
jgi:hypothetical protein